MSIKTKSYNQIKYLPYKIAAGVGLIIRNVVIPLIFPNAFEFYINKFVSTLHLSAISNRIIVFLISISIDTFIMTPIYYWLSFFSVKSSYKKSTRPAWGSICYLLYYIAYNAIVIVLFLYFTWWTILATWAGYWFVCAFIYIFSDIFGTLPYDWKLTLIIQIVLSIFVATILILVCELVF